MGAILARCIEKDKKGMVFQTANQKFRITSTNNLVVSGFVQEHFKVVLYSITNHEESDFILGCM